jgi:hypothetical protein
LITFLKDFSLGLQLPAKLVPTAGLNKKCGEMIENSIRHCAETVFGFTKAQMVEILTGMHDGLATHCVSLQGGQAETKTTCPTAAAAAAKLRGAIKRSLSLLVPLLKTTEYTPPALHLDFSDFSLSHFLNVLSCLENIVLCGERPASEGPVFSVAKDCPLSSLAALRDNQHPVFFLFVSRICEEFRTTHLKTLHKHLQSEVPGIAKSPGWKMFAMEVSQATERMGECSAALLSRYVEVVGSTLGRSASECRATSVKTPIGVSGLLEAVHGGLGLELKALALLLPVDGKHARASESPHKKPTPVRGGALRDIERLFAEKVIIFGTITYSAESLIQTALKITFKALLEASRSRILSKFDFQQLQLDVYAIRRQCPSCLSTDACKPLNVLLDQLLSCSLDRCADQDPLSSSTLRMIYDKQFEVVS